MFTRRQNIFALGACLLFALQLGCWETDAPKAGIDVSPREVRRGEVVAIGVTSSISVFAENDYDAAFYPDNGLKVGTLKRGSTRYLNIPVEIDENAPLGPRVLSLRIGNQTVEEEIEVVAGDMTAKQAISTDSDSTAVHLARLSITPSSVSRGEHVQFTVTGEDTNFSAETNVSFEPESGIEIIAVTVESSTELTFDAVVAMNASPGARILYVSGPSGQSVEVFAVEIQVLASVACYTDMYEINDNIANAAAVNFPSTSAASICAGDHDYFKVNIQAGVAVDFLIQFAHADGDLDMELLTLQGQLLQASFSRTDNELITFTAPAHQSGERVLHIFGNNGAVNNYTFTANVSGNSNCIDDGREPNDYYGAALPISFPDTFSAMLCSNDDDFFTFQVPGAMTVELSVLFNHAAGDLDLALLSDTGAILAVSDTADNNEQLVYTTTGPQLLGIRVYGIAGAENSYTLLVDELQNDTDTSTDTDTDADTATESDSDTVPPPVCPDVKFAVEPSALSIGRYTARLTLVADNNPGWVSDTTSVSLPDAPENISLEGCTVTTPTRISCNITVGLFALPEDIRIDVTQGEQTPVCGVLSIEADGIAEAEIPAEMLPMYRRYAGEIDAAGDDRSDFFHLQPSEKDLLVFHALSLDRENLDPVLRLIKDNGNEWLVYEDDETPLGIDSRMAYYFAASDDFYVEVGPKFSDAFGAYQFYVYRLTHGRTIAETAAFNDALESAQMIAPAAPYVLHGAISDENDVDVYQIAVDGPVALDVVARRLGAWDDSLADVSLTVYDANQQIVAKNATWFEAPTTADPRVFLPGAGNYLVEIMPALKELLDDDENHTGFYAFNVREPVVINEIDNRVTAEDPFVELLGPPDFDLSGFSLQTFGADGAALNPAPGVALDGQRTDGAGYFYLSDASPFGLSVVLSSGPGAVVLSKGGQVVDSVQFGLLDTGTPYAEAHPAEAGLRRTIGRGAGVDTNNNDLDFIHMANPTPGAPNDRTYPSPVPLFGESEGCHNLKKDGSETDVDCGGLCNRCADGKRCDDHDDCLGNFCESGICHAQDSCFDLKQNQDETDVDCGGGCPACPEGAGCADDNDCQSNNCDAGICDIEETCDDGLLNQDESDVDCGGTVCDACENGRICTQDIDCLSDFCDSGICDDPETCTDSILNQDESDVDCGGTICDGCVNGRICTQDIDCLSDFCDNGICDDPETCTDGIRNQNETDVDCGGVCPGCADGKICTQDIDCSSGDCAGGRCVRLTGTITITNSWGTGYCADLRIRNNSQTPVSNWNARINTRGFYPYSVWNITFSGSSSPYTVTPNYAWNRAITGGVNMLVGGWCANVAGSNWQPVIVSVKGE